MGPDKSLELNITKQATPSEGKLDSLLHAAIELDEESASNNNNNANTSKGKGKNVKKGFIPFDQLEASEYSALKKGGLYLEKSDTDFIVQEGKNYFYRPSVATPRSEWQKVLLYKTFLGKRSRLLNNTDNKMLNLDNTDLIYNGEPVFWPHEFLKLDQGKYTFCEPGKEPVIVKKFHAQAKSKTKSKKRAAKTAANAGESTTTILSKRFKGDKTDGFTPKETPGEVLRHPVNGKILDEHDDVYIVKQEQGKSIKYFFRESAEANKDTWVAIKRYKNCHPSNSQSPDRNNDIYAENFKRLIDAAGIKVVYTETDPRFKKIANILLFTENGVTQHVRKYEANKREKYRVAHNKKSQGAQAPDVNNKNNSNNNNEQSGQTSVQASLSNQGAHSFFPTAPISAPETKPTSSAQVTKPTSRMSLSYITANK